MTGWINKIYCTSLRLSNYYSKKYSLKNILRGIELYSTFGKKLIYKSSIFCWRRQWSHSGHIWPLMAKKGLIFDLKSSKFFQWFLQIFFNLYTCQISLHRLLTTVFSAWSRGCHSIRAMKLSAFHLLSCLAAYRQLIWQLTETANLTADSDR